MKTEVEQVVAGRRGAADGTRAEEPRPDGRTIEARAVADGQDVAPGAVARRGEPLEVVGREESSRGAVCEVEQDRAADAQERQRGEQPNIPSGGYSGGGGVLAVEGSADYLEIEGPPDGAVTLSACPVDRCRPGW